MGILTKDPVMAKRNKTWNHWTLALVVLTLYMVQPSSASEANWGQACTMGTTDCATGQGVCVKADGAAATGTESGTCGCVTDKVLGFDGTCADKCVQTTCQSGGTAGDGACAWGPKGDGQICVTNPGSSPGCAASKTTAVACATDTASPTTPFCVLTAAAEGTCQGCKAGWKCPTANHECLADGKCGEPKACDVKANCSTQPNGLKECVAKAGGSKFCGKGCGETACTGATPICVVPDLASTGTCKACDTTLTCPTGKTCVAKACVVATTPLTSSTTVASPSDTTNSTKNTDNTDNTTDVMGSTTANNTNSAPGMPSAAGSLILLTCAAALVLAAA